ncbi:type II toxin-antitoxin system RelE family toxin [Pinibacter aurantiacus]|uniref:Type II toxin-antitoxin system RelE/ParE family toxin n=1 Tax=Pinibacter aurantiacus TaxID=2851599 RepID=A0A9E2W4B9_9BACT|nr:type II toxin-antitoxin system RelE/ParE family toxin [Pinibacter aurantiacus]MBV4359550.1 type II toxin-antitoxin system RelE/ParE family toxin [Pinibacter aurantiacus]
MSYRIVYTKDFEKEIKRLASKYPSLKIDLQNFINELTENPTMGTSLGNNCYKVRIAISSKGKGKSGGARIITFVKISIETILLISIYDKSQQVTITDKEIKERLSKYFDQ